MIVVNHPERHTSVHVHIHRNGRDTGPLNVENAQKKGARPRLHLYIGGHDLGPVSRSIQALCDAHRKAAGEVARLAALEDDATTDEEHAAEVVEYRAAAELAWKARTTGRQDLCFAQGYLAGLEKARGLTVTLEPLLDLPLTLLEMLLTSLREVQAVGTKSDF